MTLQWLAFAFICLKGVVFVVFQPAQLPIDVFIDLLFWAMALIVMLDQKEKYKDLVVANEILIGENATLEVYRQEHYELSEAITWLMRR